jgi:hypothetical protein
MRQDRLVRGLLVACATAMIVAFLAGGVYAVIVGTPEGAAFRLTADALEGIFVIGWIAAVVATPIAGIAAFALALPLFRFCVSRNYASPLVYVGGGILISLVVAGLFALAHYFAGFLGPGPDIRLGIFAALAAGPLSALAFWFVVRPLPSAA